jgi:hypothetical protein
MQSSPSYPNVGPRDTSNEPIKSDYELSDENAAKNARIMAARNRAQSLVNTGKDKREESFYNTVVRPQNMQRDLSRQRFKNRANPSGRKLTKIRSSRPYS